MSRKKSVSLFEALPPRGGERSPQKTTEKPKDKAQLAKNTARKSVDVNSLSQPKAKANTEITPNGAQLPSAKPIANTDPSAHQVSGISVAKKDDHFYAIAFCMIAFSTITFVGGYKLGNHDANAKLTQLQISQRTAPPRSQGLAAQTQPTTNVETKVEEKTLILPTSLQHLTKEQTQRVAPPTPPRNYTLQIETLRGQNQQGAINNLVSKLKSLGYDAFANRNNGAVYVGRLESSRSTEAKRLKQDIVKLNRGSYADAFFIRIPSHLLENP